MKTGYKILLATLKTFHTTSYTRTRKCQSSLNIIIMASIQKCTIFHLKNMRKGTSFSLIFPVLIVITLAHNCTQILVQLCDKFIHISNLVRRQQDQLRQSGVLQHQHVYRHERVELQLLQPRQCF